MKWTGDHPGLERLGAYHDRELEPSEALAVETHLQSCRACRDAMAEIAQVDEVGALFRDDLPGDADPLWPSLTEKIRERLASGEEREIETVGPLAGRRTAPAVVPAATGGGANQAGWWTRIFGTGPSLRWGLATAAGIVVVVLASRLVVTQLSPTFMARGSRIETALSRPAEQAAGSAAGATSEAPPRAAESPADRIREMKRGAPAGAPQPPAVAARKPAGIPGAVVGTAPEAHELAERPGEGAVTATKATPESGTSFKSLAAAGPADHVAILQKNEPARPAVALGAESKRPAGTPQGIAPPAAATTPEEAPPPAAAASSAETSPAGRPAGAPGPAAAGGETRAARAPGRENEALAYAALVDRELRTAADSNVVIIPPPRMTRFQDYSIAYAAAMRALDAGRPELARRGFSLVALGVPDSALAREAEYNERLAQVRVREQQGEDRELILQSAQENADNAWDLAQTRRLPATCRAALAFERVRVTLLREIRPAADLKPFEDRIRILRACA